MKYRLWRSGEIVDISAARKIGEGGEAGVFCIDALKMAAKLYHHPDARHEAKLKVMLENPPTEPSEGVGHVSIAWPRDLLLERGHFRGYIMPFVEGMLPLVNYYVPKLRRQRRPLFDYFYLVTAALNVATAVRALHDRAYVIGDVNESNVLLSDRALATVVDTDSFQVTDAGTGMIYRCPVGKPEFTPPELQLPGTNFALVDRAREHDNFGLAVMLFQLLMEGTHPFDGVYSEAHEPPSIDQRISAGHFPHRGGVAGPIRPKPIAPPFGILDPGLQHLFTQCFVDGHRDPVARPDAATWHTALENARQQMRTCSVNDRHRHWGHVPCPWCERAARLGGADPFPSVEAVKKGLHLQQRTTGAVTPQRAVVPVRTLPGTAQAAIRAAQAIPPRYVTTPAQRRAAVLRQAQTGARRVYPQSSRPTGMSFSTIARLVFFGYLALAGLYSMVTAVKPTYPSSISPIVPRPNPASLSGSSPRPARTERFLPTRGASFRAPYGIRMVWISPGPFKMGDAIENGNPDEQPVHEAYLTKGYWLADSEVTQAQWTSVMGTRPGYFKGKNLPVESITWSEATGFCRKLTESERANGNLATGMEYRLPTEAQWEKACRAGTAGDYGSELSATTWFDWNSDHKTHDVKAKRPNAWGFYDMQGNVCEWCADWYGGYSDGVQIDPQGPATGSERVIRGGSWFRSSSYSRSASRSRLAPNLKFDNLGFRVAAVQSDSGIAVPMTTPAGQQHFLPPDSPLSLNLELKLKELEQSLKATPTPGPQRIPWHQ